MNLHPLIPFFTAFFICVILTPLIRRVAIKKDLLAKPAKDRWHKKSTALFGGIAIFAGIAITLCFVTDFSDVGRFVSDPSKKSNLPSFGVATLIGSALLFILGLIDDIITIKPQTKLIGQILVASLITFLGYRLHWFHSLTIDTVVTLFWIVGITNAFNLLDNMDGLCAGIGLVTAFFLWLLFAEKSVEVAQIAIILAGALAAFLVYNFNPASIFMGDSGSLTIGFVVSMLCLQYSQTSTGNIFSPYAVPLLITMVPILDTTLVSAIRILSGRKASTGGKDHTSHRLILMGFSEKRAVLFLYGTAIVSGIAAYFVSRADAFATPAVFAPVLISFLLMGIYLAQLRIYPEKEFSRLRNKSFTPVLIELTYKRQIMTVLLDFFLISFAYYLSWQLRFDAEEFNFYFRVFLHSLPVVVSCKLLVFFIVGVYREIWGRMSTNDTLVHIKATMAASLLSIALVTFLYGFKNFSKGVFVIDWLLTTGLILGSRGSFRFFIDFIMRNSLAGERVIIYGAGRGGELLLREILNNQRLSVRPIGFIDDDTLKVGKKLQGFPILGSIKDITDIYATYKFDGVLMAFKDEKSEVLESVRQFCRLNNLFLKRFSIQLDDIENKAPVKDEPRQKVYLINGN